jgi:hypothetical protein
MGCCVTKQKFPKNPDIIQARTNSMKINHDFLQSLQVSAPFAPTNPFPTRSSPSVFPPFSIYKSQNPTTKPKYAAPKPSNPSLPYPPDKEEITLINNLSISISVKSVSPDASIDVSSSSGSLTLQFNNNVISEISLVDTNKGPDISSNANENGDFPSEVKSRSELCLTAPVEVFAGVGSILSAEDQVFTDPGAGVNSRGVDFGRFSNVANVDGGFGEVFSTGSSDFTTSTGADFGGFSAGVADLGAGGISARVNFGGYSAGVPDFGSGGF